VRGEAGGCGTPLPGLHIVGGLVGVCGKTGRGKKHPGEGEGKLGWEKKL